MFVTGLAVFMGFLDTTIVNIAFPAIQRSFQQVDRAELSWVLNAYNVLFAALLVPAGRLADRLGRRRCFFTGLAIFVLASALCAIAPGASLLIAARCLQALGAAVIIPTSLALLLACAPVGQRATAVGLWGIGAASAAAAGPSLGGLIIEEAGWRWVFLLNVPIGLLVYLLGRSTLRRTLEERRAEQGAALPDILGGALLALCMGALALGIVNGQSWGWGGARVIGAFSVAAIAGLSFVGRSRRHPVPMVDRSLLRTRSFVVGNAGTLLFAMSFYALLLNNVLFMTSVWRFSILSAGGALTTTPLTTAICAAPFGRLADRVGHRTLIVPGCLLYAAAALWFAARLGSAPDFIGGWLPGGIAAGIGIALAFPTLASASVNDLSAHWLGTGSAVNAAARQVGAVLGVALIVAILAASTSTATRVAYEHGWRIMSIVTLCAAGVGMLLPRAQRATLSPTAKPRSLEVK